MEQGKIVLNHLEKRKFLLTQLKDSLLNQQKALVKADADQVTAISEEQINCVERIQQAEIEWQAVLTEIKVNNNLPSIDRDQIVSMVLDNNDNLKVFAYLDQIKTLASEIDTIKRNNTLLIHNSISLVRSTIRQLQGNRFSDAVYHPGKRTTSNHMLVNKKF